MFIRPTLPVKTFTLCVITGRVSFITGKVAFKGEGGLFPKLKTEKVNYITAENFTHKVNLLFFLEGEKLETKKNIGS